MGHRSIGYQLQGISVHMYQWAISWVKKIGSYMIETDSSYMCFDVVNLTLSASSAQKCWNTSNSILTTKVGGWLNPVWYTFLDDGAIHCHM